MSSHYVRPVAAAKRALGERGEALASAYLRGLGMRITHRNLRLPTGEIDLVAYDGDLLVVVEVRTRGSAATCGPLLSIGPEKRERIRRNAEQLAQLLNVSRKDPIRIDVVGVVIEGNEARIEHHANAC